MSRIGTHTVALDNRPYILASAALGGCKGDGGPLGGCFDIQLDDDKFGEPSWEKAESKMQKETMLKLLQKAELAPDGYPVYLRGRPAQPVYQLQLRTARLGIPFFRPLPGLFHHGGGPVPGEHGGRGRVCQPLYRAHVLALRVGRAAVPLPDGVRTAHAERTVDRNRLRRRRCQLGEQPRLSARQPYYNGRHRRPRHQGCEQYGRRNGPRGLRHL